MSKTDKQIADELRAYAASHMDEIRADAARHAGARATQPSAPAPTPAAAPPLAAVPLIDGSTVIRGLPLAAYLATSALSSGGLQAFRQSPLHYFAREIDPERPPRPKSTPSQLLGSMVHCGTLEPAEFPRRYVSGPESRRGTKVWDAFEASLSDDQIGVKPDEYHQAFAMARSLRRHPELASMFSSGQSELSVFARDPDSGVMLRARPDWTHTYKHGVILVDLKTCDDASKVGFARQIARQGYQFQAAHYIDVYEAATDVRVLAFLFAPVETEYPHACNVIQVDPADIDHAREINRELLTRFAECQRTTRWPGYGDGVEQVSLPRWAMETT